MFNSEGPQSRLPGDKNRKQLSKPGRGSGCTLILGQPRPEPQHEGQHQPKYHQNTVNSARL